MYCDGLSNQAFQSDIQPFPCLTLSLSSHLSSTVLDLIFYLKTGNFDFHYFFSSQFIISSLKFLVPGHVQEINIC